MIDNKVLSNTPPHGRDMHAAFGSSRTLTNGPDATGLWSNAAWLPKFWRGLSLNAQFLAIATLVVCSSMLILGQWLNSQIVAGQIRSRAESGSLYMQAFLAPHVRHLGNGFEVSEANYAELDRALLDPEMVERVEGARIWRRDGTIVYSTEKSLIGKKMLTADVARAFTGAIVAQLETAPDDEGGLVRSYPLLEIYAPIYRDKTNDVIAVGEFYEQAEDFIAVLSALKWRTWAIVGIMTSAMMAIFYFIIARANRLIESQKVTMGLQLASANELAAQNKALSDTAEHLRIASTRASERLLNRIGSDLHDGPVQLLTLLILGFGQRSRRLGRSNERNEPLSGTEDEEQEKLARQVLTELRELSTGLVLPDLEGANLEGALSLAVQRHEKATGTVVETTFRNLATEIDPGLKICCFRVVQEGLNNAFRHGQGKSQRVEIDASGDNISIRVQDSGPGPNDGARAPRRTHPLGLQGIRNRVEVFGGTVELRKRQARGAELFVELPLRNLHD